MVMDQAICKEFASMKKLEPSLNLEAIDRIAIDEVAAMTST